MQMLFDIGHDLCGHCGRDVRFVAGAHIWQDQSSCSLQCSHDAGNRTMCDGWNCGCTAYSKQHRVLRAALLVRVGMRIKLRWQGHLTAEDFEMGIEDEYSLPYNPDEEVRLADLEDEEDCDDMDPDRERRGMASQKALVDAVAVIVNHRENKRRRSEIESKLKSTRLNLERKAMQYEDLRSRQLRD